MTPDKVKVAASLMKDKTNRIKDICKTLGVSRATLYRYVTPDGEIRSAQGNVGVTKRNK
jgi:ACT domain-containing protein